QAEIPSGAAIRGNTAPLTFHERAERFSPSTHDRQAMGQQQRVEGSTQKTPVGFLQAVLDFRRSLPHVLVGHERQWASVLAHGPIGQADSCAMPPADLR